MGGWVETLPTDRSFFEMQCCPSYVPDIPVLITYASNCSDVSLEQLRLRRACAIVHYRHALAAYAYTELGRT